MADQTEQCLCTVIVNGKLDMFGREAVHQWHCRIKAFADDDRAICLPAFRCDLCRCQLGQLGRHSRHNRVCKHGVIGEQHRLACRIMFSLTQKVGRNPFRIIGRISNDNNFGRPGHHVDPDLAVKLALCLCHKGIARAGDHIDRRNAFTAMCQRGNRLCAAKPPNLIHAGKMRGGHHRRIHLPVRRRRDHHDPFHACNLGRNNVHQQRRRIGGTAARHIDTRCIDRAPARTKTHTSRVAIIAIFGQLCSMLGAHTFGCELQRIA